METVAARAPVPVVQDVSPVADLPGRIAPAVEKAGIRETCLLLP